MCLRFKIRIYDKSFIQLYCMYVCVFARLPNLHVNNNTRSLITDWFSTFFSVLNFNINCKLYHLLYPYYVKNRRLEVAVAQCNLLNSVTKQAFLSVHICYKCILILIVFLVWESIVFRNMIVPQYDLVKCKIINK